MRFENQICPVCNEKFNENDEIVVCPDCGTPHHRNCYNSLGECKNKSLHSEGFSFKLTHGISFQRFIKISRKK